MRFLVIYNAKLGFFEFEGISLSYSAALLPAANRTCCTCTKTSADTFKMLEYGEFRMCVSVLKQK